MAQRGIAVARDTVAIAGRVRGATPTSANASGTVEIRGAFGAGVAGQSFAAVTRSAVSALGARRVVHAASYAFLEGTHSAARADTDQRPAVGIALRIGGA